LNAEHLAHPKFTYFWSGLFDTGLALTRGNSSTTTFTLATKEVRETPKNKLTLYATYIYGNDATTPPSRTTANALNAGARFDYNLTPKLYAFALADYQTNALQYLDLRQTYGGGLGYHVIKNPNTTFDVFGGLTYERDAFGSYVLLGPPISAIGAITSNSLTAVVGEEFDKKFNSRTTFMERLSLYPNLSTTGDIRSQFDTSLVTALKSWLSWHITFSDSYINYPPPGLKDNDLLLSTGLRVTWGKAKL
jgi:putative salt-induced outer membrane protein YdiY